MLTIREGIRFIQLHIDKMPCDNIMKKEGLPIVLNMKYLYSKLQPLEQDT